MECVADIVFQSLNVNPRSRKLWYKRAKMVGIVVGSIAIVMFALVTSVEALQTYNGSQEEYIYNLQEYDDKFAGKYVSFDACDVDNDDTKSDTDLFSKMLTTSYYIREYLKYDRKIMDPHLMDNRNININKNDNICTYFECDEHKIRRIDALAAEYKASEVELDYAMVTVSNDGDIWSLQNEKGEYYIKKMLNINYCPNSLFYEWSTLRKDLCSLFHCKSLSNDAKHLNLEINVVTDYDEEIKGSLVIDLSDIQCHSKLFILQWIPYFGCVFDITNEKQFDVVKEDIITDIDVHLEKVDNKNVIYVIGDKDSSIYKGILEHYQGKDVNIVVLDDYNEEMLNLMVIASNAQCFVGSFYSDLSNDIVLNRGWDNDVCNGWYKTHGVMTNIKFGILILFCFIVVNLGFQWLFLVFRNQMRKKNHRCMILEGILMFGVMFFVIYNIFALAVNVLMQFKFI